MKKQIVGVMGKLTISATEEGRVALITLEGEIDVYTSQEVKKIVDAYLDREIDAILLDMEQVKYLDSSTISLLIGTLERLKPSGRRLMLVKLSENAKKIFAMANLLTIFEIYDDVEEAKKSIT